MGREIVTVVKLKLWAGQATPAPPVGPALGQKGVNIGQFVMQFNQRTREQNGAEVSVAVTIYNDKSFSFIVSQPTAVFLLKEAAGVRKGSGQPNKDPVGTISQAQLRRIAEIKMPDFNTNSLEAAMRIIAGTARSIGVVVKSD